MTPKSFVLTVDRGEGSPVAFVVCDVMKCLFLSGFLFVFDRKHY